MRHLKLSDRDLEMNEDLLNVSGMSGDNRIFRCASQKKNFNFDKSSLEFDN